MTHDLGNLRVRIRHELAHRQTNIRYRFDRWVIRWIYPTRPFITFGPGATLDGATIEEHDGVIHVAVAANAYIRGINAYDARFNLASGAHVCDSKIVARRPVTGDDAMLRVNATPPSTLDGMTIQGY